MGTANGKLRAVPTQRPNASQRVEQDDAGLSSRNYNNGAVMQDFRDDYGIEK